MRVKTTLVVKEVSGGSCLVDFSSSPDADQVAAYMGGRVGETVELLLSPDTEPAGSREAAAPASREPLKKAGLSACAKGSYWNTEESKKR